MADAASSVAAAPPSSRSSSRGATMAVVRKELRSFFVGPIPYLVAVFFSAVLTWFVFEQGIFLVLRRASLDSLFGYIPIVSVLVVPAVAMRSWAEEIRGETLETLMTSPVRVRSLVLGKFLAAMVVLAVCLLATAGIPITAAALGEIDVGPLVGGYVGALLLLGAYLAIGQWLSSITRNQIIAFLLGLVVCFAFFIVDRAATSGASGQTGSFLSAISMNVRFQAIARGVFDLRDVVYFLSVIGFFLYLNVESVENRRHA